MNDFTSSANCSQEKYISSENIFLAIASIFDAYDAAPSRIRLVRELRELADAIEEGEHE